MRILKPILFTLLVSFIVSCSEQQFAFRQKVRVQQYRVQESYQPKVGASSTKPLENNQLLASIASEVSEKKQEETQLSVPKLVNKPTQIEGDSTKRKKYKFDDDSEKPRIDNKSNNEKSYKSNSDINDTSANKWAIIGFILSISSIFLILTCIPGFIFSIKGIRSKQLKGLAIAGLVISAVVLAFLLLYLFVIMLFIASYR